MTPFRRCLRASRELFPHDCRRFRGITAEAHNAEFEPAARPGSMSVTRTFFPTRSARRLKRIAGRKLSSRHKRDLPDRDILRQPIPRFRIRAGVALDHARQNRACHMDKPRDVRCDHSIPIVQRCFPSRGKPKCQSCIIDENVDLAPFFRQRANESCDRISIGDVEGNGMEIGSPVRSPMPPDVRFAVL